MVTSTKLKYTNYITIGFIFLLFYAIISLVGMFYFQSSVSLWFYAIIGVILVIGQYFVSPWMLDRFNKIQFADKNDALYMQVNEEAKKAGLPPVRVGLDPSPVMNAYTYGRNQSTARVVLTKGLMQKNIDGNLSKDELNAIINHELGHIKNRDMTVITIASLLPMVVSYIAFALVLNSGDNDNNSFGSGIMQWMMANFVSQIIYFIFNLPVLYLSRLREYGADEFSARTMHSSGYLISALEKIHQSVSLPDAKKYMNPSMSSMYIDTKGAIELFSTHPNLEKRISFLKKLRV
ncbi:MAG: M48 family metalloprotease [Candidatus Aenigmarchaeota archaeon]|nr:M48 family metalloprotease [Candidatus Aenigmarchaeota archaeon]